MRRMEQAAAPARCWAGLRAGLSSGLVAMSVVMSGRAADPEALTPPTPRIPAYFQEVQSPIDTFRGMLAMTLEERLAALASRSEAQRRTLLGKLEEYQAMENRERELRLRLIELRLYLVPILHVPVDQRDPMLAKVPARLGGFIGSRLNEWDRLTDGHQREILSNEKSLHYFIYRARSNSVLTAGMIQKITPLSVEQSRRVNETMRRWRGLTEEERRELAQQVRHLFSLSSREQLEFLRVAPAEDRVPLQMVLRRFARMSPEQRERCLEGFNKLARLNAAEQRSFLLHAERWTDMSSAQRDLWRSLVQAQASAIRRP